MEYTILIIVVSIIVICIWATIESGRRERERRGKLRAEAEAFIAGIKHARALPIVDTHIMLKKGEVAFYSAPSALHETRAVRQYQAGHTGFRVAKGVYIGGSRGRSTSTQQWSRIDQGYLTVTNKRLIFDGAGQDRAIQLNKVMSVQSGSNGIEISVEGRQKSMVFDAPNSLILAAIIHICCQTEDPCDLSETTLDVTFEG